MINYSQLLNEDLYNKSQKEKDKFFLKNFYKLHKHHKKNSKEYNQISKSLFNKKFNKIENFPFLHVQMFKDNDLRSVSTETKTKTFNSSGTTGNSLSKINLDMKTSLLQSKTLSKILLSVLKTKVDKVYFIDSETTLKKMPNSASGAAILGFKQIANSYEFILNSNYKVKKNIINKILKDEKNICFFGFTSIVWINLISYLKKNKIFLNKKDCILFHGGGWKKIEKSKVSRKKFNSTIKQYIGTNKIINYYGMIEQTGSIFLECDNGFYHPSILSEIIIRDQNMLPSGKGSIGLIQVCSLLPISYPGHSILTEDLGKIVAVDNCKCGRKGKFFEVIERVKNSEVRGCSDVYE